MAQELVAIRMTRTIDQLPVVLELRQDEVYWLPREYSDRLITAGSAEPAPQPVTPRLEAATLAGPRRRG